ncbi:hypothetical protein PL78_18400 [Yersinia entomophaga]|uniref:J domain-containing protein n=3 Tax=Yersinia entomophaga TaxID=935293 RepID=A0ABN4PXQ5_YERET|nr:hypothetical protein PL78_18400 [Yersinia entomophaga]
METNCWALLGVAPTEDQEIIQAAYRQRLPDFHPESDPEGFKRLRAAYDEARRWAEKPVISRSLWNQNNVTESEQRISVINNESDSEEDEDDDDDEFIDEDYPAIQRLLSEFDELLVNPTERYQPESWHRFIYHLDQYSVTIVDRLRWPLLGRVHQGAALSANCVRLLAERLQWRKRLDEISLQAAADMDAFLNHIYREDMFDFSLLSSMSLPAQVETVVYFHHARQLYWEQPAAALRRWLLMPVAIFWPDCQQLLQQMARWFSLAEIPSPWLRDLCQAKLAESPRDADWLYLCARHANLLGDGEQAIAHWMALYQLDQHAEAEQGMLSWCRREQPEMLPLLIQALDRPSYPADTSMEIDDDEQQYLRPTQSIQTQVRWGNASQLTFSPQGEALVKWKSGAHRLESMYPHLLNNRGENEIDRLYWHASMLALGNEALLQDILDEPQPDSPLAALILHGLQRQAAQRLDWLTHSTVIAGLIHWLNSPQDQPMPSILGQETAIRQCQMWLWQWRHLPALNLAHLYESELYQPKLEPIKDWLTFLSTMDKIELPAPQNISHRDDFRQGILLILMLGFADDQMATICQADSRLLPPQHLAFSLFRAFKRVDLTRGNGVEQLKHQLRMEDRLHYLCWTHLPLTVDDYVAHYQYCAHVSGCDFYQAKWQSLMAQSPMPHKSLLWAFFSYHGVHDYVAALQEQQTETRDEAAFKKMIVDITPPHLESKTALLKENPRLLSLATGNFRFYDNPDYLPEQSLSDEWLLWAQDEEEDPALRLTAIMLVQLGRERLAGFKNAPRQVSRFWQFWRLKTRLGRGGLVKQVAGGTLLISLVGDIVLLDTLPNTLLLSVLMVGNLFSGLTRRANDLNQESPRLQALVSMLTLFPLLLFFFGKSYPGFTHSGPPAGNGE